MESVHLGVKGIVVDEDSQPVPNAVVKNKLVKKLKDGFSSHEILF